MRFFYCGQRLRAYHRKRVVRGGNMEALNERQLHLNCIHETAVNQFAWLMENKRYIYKIYT